MVLPYISLTQLAYASVARPAFGEAEIGNILEVSRRRNREHGVTGVLLYQRGLVLQVLEGPPAAVKTLFANIQRDSRHTGVHCLYETEIPEREFPDWSMAFHYAEFGYCEPPEGFNSMLTEFLNVRIDPERRGSLFLLTFAGLTR